MTHKPLGTLNAFTTTMVSQSARRGFKLCCYAAALTVYPTEAWGHAVDALEDLSMSIGAAKFAIYHAIVVWHIAHDAKALFRALNEYGKPLEIVRLFPQVLLGITKLTRRRRRLLRAIVLVVATVIC